MGVGGATWLWRGRGIKQACVARLFRYSLGLVCLHRRGGDCQHKAKAKAESKVMVIVMSIIIILSRLLEGKRQNKIMIEREGREILLYPYSVCVCVCVQSLKCKDCDFCYNIVIVIEKCYCLLVIIVIVLLLSLL